MFLSKTRRIIFASGFALAILGPLLAAVTSSAVLIMLVLPGAVIALIPLIGYRRASERPAPARLHYRQISGSKKFLLGALVCAEAALVCFVIPTGLRPKGIVPIEHADPPVAAPGARIQFTFKTGAESINGIYRISDLTVVLEVETPGSGWQPYPKQPIAMPDAHDTWGATILTHQAPKEIPLYVRVNVSMPYDEVLCGRNAVLRIQGKAEFPSLVPVYLLGLFGKNKFWTSVWKINENIQFTFVTRDRAKEHERWRNLRRAWHTIGWIAVVSGALFLVNAVPSARR